MSFSNVSRAILSRGIHFDQLLSRSTASRFPLLISLSVSICCLSYLAPAANSETAGVRLMKTQNSPLFPTEIAPQQTLGEKPHKFDKTPLKKPLTAGVQKTGAVSDSNQEKASTDLGTVTLDTIDIEGNDIYRESVISGALNPLKHYLEKHDNQIDQPTLERYIRDINTVYPFKLQGDVITTEDNRQQLKFDVYESSPIHLSTSFSNNGRPGSGVYRWGAEATHTSITGLGDSLQAMYVGGVNFQQASVSYTSPIYNRLGGNATLGHRFGHANYDVNKLDASDEDNIFSNAYITYLRFNQPLDRKKRLTAYAQTNYVHYDTFTNHVHTYDDTYVMVIGGLAGNFSDRYGKTTFDLNSLHGWSTDLTRQYYFRERATASRVIKLPHDQSVTLRAMGQYADYLPIGLDIPLGGAFNLRGYTPNLLNGDRGYLANLEYQFPIPGLKKVLPKVGIEAQWADRIRGLVFADMGQAWVDNSNPRFRPGKSNDSGKTLLMSTGVGVRARITRYFQAYCDLGYGLYNPANIELLSRPTVRAHFGIRSDIIEPATFQKHDGPAHRVFTAKK